MKDDEMIPEVRDLRRTVLPSGVIEVYFEAIHLSRKAPKEIYRPATAVYLRLLTKVLPELEGRDLE